MNTTPTPVTALPTENPSFLSQHKGKIIGVTAIVAITTGVIMLRRRDPNRKAQRLADKYTKAVEKANKLKLEAEAALAAITPKATTPQVAAAA